MSVSNTKIVARSAMMLYARTAVALVIQLVAVRYLLKYLGNDDFGLYGLIGSVVAVVESLKGMFSSSIQRYINVERGRNNEHNIRDIFNVGLRIHIVIGLVLTLCTIAVGVLAIPYLNIPQDSFVQAYVVLVLSSVTMGIGMVIVPYDALIVAYERFDAYAVISIVSNVLKLLIVFCLLLFPEWRVSVYAALLLGVTIVTRIINTWYCRHHFSEIIKISKVENRSYYREMAGFAGIKSLGTISATLQSSAMNMVLNLFGGLVVNTARTVAYQVLTAVNVMVWNINMGFTPRCITLWGEGRKDEFYRLMYLQSKLCFVVNAILGCVIATFAVPMLRIWLDEIPDYAALFLQLIFLYAVLKSFQDSIDLVFTADGHLKRYQFTVTLCNIVSIAVAYLSLRAGCGYGSVFVVMAVSEFVIVAISMIIARATAGFPLADYLKRVVSRVAVGMLLSVVLFVVSVHYISQIDNVFMLIALFVGFGVLEAAMILVSVFSQTELKAVLDMVRRKKYE